MRFKKFAFVLMIALVISSWGAVRGVLAQDPLTETFTTADGSLTVQYPEGWQVTETNGFVVLVNSKDVLENEVMEEGEVSVVLVPPSLLNQLYADTGQDLPTYFAELVEVVNMGGDTYGEFTPLEVNGFPALKSLTASDTADGLMIMIDYPEGRLLMASGYRTGDRALYEATILAILETVVLQSTNASTPTTDASAPQVLWQMLYQQAESTAAGPLLAAVNAIALDPEGYLLYIAAGEGGVTLINADGEMVDTFSPPSVGDTPGNIIAVDVASDGTFWVADIANKVLHQLDDDGNLLQTAGQAAPDFETGDPGEFDDLGPTQLHIGPDERLYVMNQAIGRENRIMIFAPDGTFESEFKLAEPEAFGSYGKFAVAPDGTLYLSVQKVTTTSRLVVMDTAGNLLREIPLQLPPEVEEYGPIGALVVLEDGTFWATDSFDGVIYHFDATGAILASFGQAQTGELNAPFTPGEFSRASGTGLNGLVVLDDGDVIVGDMNSEYSQVVRIDFGG